MQGWACFRRFPSCCSTQQPPQSADRARSPRGWGRGSSGPWASRRCLSKRKNRQRRMGRRWPLCRQSWLMTLQSSKPLHQSIQTTHPTPVQQWLGKAPQTRRCTTRCRPFHCLKRLRSSRFLLTRPMATCRMSVPRIRQTPNSMGHQGR